MEEIVVPRKRRPPAHFLTNPKFKANMGRITKENRASMQKAINKGKAKGKYTERSALRDDIFADIAKNNRIGAGLNVVMTQAEEGNTKPMLDLLKIITPKEVEATVKGEFTHMGEVSVDGIDLNLNIGSKSRKRD